MASANKWVPEAIRFGVDRESGAEIEQLTSEPVTSTNIYCEQRFTSADGKRIAIERKPFGRPAEMAILRQGLEIAKLPECDIVHSIFLSLS